MLALYLGTVQYAQQTLEHVMQIQFRVAGFPANPTNATLLQTTRRSHHQVSLAIPRGLVERIWIR